MGEGTLYGVYAATVVDVRDPEALGRVRVRLASRKVPGVESVWTRLATLMAGDGRGTWFVPDVGDEVLVAFEAGDAAHPYVVGALWNASAKPPESIDAGGDNPCRVIATRSGARIAIDDAAQSVEIADANGNSIRLDPSGIALRAAAKVRIVASSAEMSVGMLEIAAGMSKFSGVVSCDTLQANSVVASSYTPGAGNLW